MVFLDVHAIEDLYANVMGVGYTDLSCRQATHTLTHMPSLAHTHARTHARTHERMNG